MENSKQKSVEELKNLIRSYMVRRGLNSAEVAELLNAKFGKNENMYTLNNKLNRGSLKYRDVQEIADVLGYKIVWEEQ